MKFMKLGSKPDSFQSEGDNVRYVSSDLATDVIVTIGDVKFYLHKFPLLSKSARLQKLIATTSSNEDNEIHQEEDEIVIPEIPGGAASFEICAKFCYGMTVTLNAYNVVAARCAAEFLEMHETVEKGNLVYKIEVFLNSSILQSWKDSIITLQTTRALSPHAEELKLTGRCLESIASRACIDTSRVEWSYTYSKKKNLDNGLRRPQAVPRDWWVEDLCDLHIALYKRVIAAIESRGKVSADVIGEALHAYATKRVPGFSKSSSSVQITDYAKYRALVGSIIEMIPEEKRSVSSSFLTKLLRASIFLGCDEETGLINRVGERLDEASLSDVMLYDVDLMLNLVEVFLKSRSEEDDVTRKASVAKLVDGYLAERSRDSDKLTLQKFLAIAEMVSGFPRQSHDGVYRAIDMFLKEHPEINKSEKKRICRLMDCRKLSVEACAHAVQNERLPMRVVVQVLFFEQARANNNNNNNGSSSTGNSTPEIIPASRSTNTEDETESWDTEDIKTLRGELASLRLAKNQQQENIKGKLVKGEIDSSFHNPNICLNFAGCYGLSRNARRLIHTSDCKYALLPGEEVPEHFPHQADSGSLTINLTPRPLPSSLRFKACVLLSICHEGFTTHKDGVSCNVIGKQNGLTIQYGSNEHHMPFRFEEVEDHLYIFEDSFNLNQDCPEAGEATLSELLFEFLVHGNIWKVKGCGVRLLFPDSIIDINAANDDDDDDGNKVESDHDDGDEVESDDDESMLVPGVQVPANFIYRATSGFLKINQIPQPLPPYLRFKACILLSRVNINFEDDEEDVSYDDDEEDKYLLMRVSYRFRGKQNDRYGSYERDMPYLYGCDDHLYTFEYCFWLYHDCPEATFSELMFHFKVFYNLWEVKACGVQLLEGEEESGRDEDEDDDGDNDEVEEEIQDDVDKTQGEESRRDDDGETRSTTSEVQPFCRYMKLTCCYIL